MEAEIKEAGVKKESHLWVAASKRGFYERTICGLMIGGMDCVHLHALDDDIGAAIDLTQSLQDKKIATVVKVSTRSKRSQDVYRYRMANNKSGRALTQPTSAPCIDIDIRRHDEFKERRISSNHAVFSTTSPDYLADLFSNHSDTNVVAVVIPGNKSLELTGNEDLERLGSILSSKGYSTATLREDRAAAVAYAWDVFYLQQQQKQQNSGSKEIFRTVEIPSSVIKSKDFTSVHCLPCVSLYSERNSSDTCTVGSVIIEIFEKETCIYEDQKMYAMIYVVCPTLEDYVNREDFLRAVRKTAANLMTSMCDISGKVRRTHNGSSTLKRFNSVNVPLFPILSKDKETEISKMQLATEIILGFEDEYRYVMSPILKFLNEENIFKLAWNKGIDINAKGTACTDVDVSTDASHESLPSIKQ